MKKNDIIDLDNVDLDPYEQEIEDSLEKGDWVPVKNQAKAKKEAVLAAKNTLKQLKNKNINLRLSSADLAKVKQKAARKGIPYQTLISSLIHQYVTGDIKANL